MSIREEFYSGLRREFQEDDFTKSFLYQYLQQKKDEEIQRDRENRQGEDDTRRKDPYVRLKVSMMELDEGKIRQEECLKKLLQVLIKNSKLRLDEDVREILWDYGRQLRRGVFDGLRQDKQRYEALLCVLEAGPPARPLRKEAWEKLCEEALKRALAIDAKTFMYDAGFPLSDEKRETISSRKKDGPLDMLDAYCRDRQLSLRGKNSGGSQGLDNEQKTRIEAFYRKLQKSPKSEKLLIPIQIDPCTGAGLYIIGKAYYRQIPSLYRRISGSCCYAFFCLDDIPPEDDELSEEERQVYLRYPAESECDFPNLDEAWRWYSAMSREKGLSFFHGVNRTVPVDCPEELRVYFRGGQMWGSRDTREFTVSKEEVAAAAAECGELQEGRKHNG